MFHDKSKHIRDMVQRGAMKLQYIATNDQIADVLMKPLARVKLSTLGRSLVFSTSRSLLKGSDESMSHSNMVRGLVPSMVRCKG